MALQKKDKEAKIEEKRWNMGDSVKRSNIYQNECQMGKMERREGNEEREFPDVKMWSLR